MAPIIEVKNLGKEYFIGEKQKYLALRDTLMNIAEAPFRWLKSKIVLLNDETRFWALNGVNFTVEKGEVLGIIGRNGAGKSTLLKILSQVTPPTTGEIKLMGRVGSLLEVGTGFHPELTGRENIYLNGAILGMRKKEIEKKFDEIVEFSGIEKFLDTPVKRYSSGMHVRLAFAVAAHLDPEILVVDEVLAVGDAEFQKKCLGKMEDVTKNSGRTVLFVSHNMEAVRNLCERCILLDKGQIAFDGSTKEAIERYNNIQSAGKLKINKGQYNKNRRGSGTLSYTNIEMVDIHGHERNTFNIGETVRFKLSYEVFEEMEGLHAALCIFSGKARDLLLTDVRGEVKNGVIKKGEKGVFEIEVELTSIRHGEYILYFWLGDKAATMQGNPVNYDVVEDMIGPLVVKLGDNEQEEKRTTGIFSLPAKIICN